MSCCCYVDVFLLLSHACFFSCLMRVAVFVADGLYLRSVHQDSSRIYLGTMGNGAFVWKGHGYFVEQRNQRWYFPGDARSCCIRNRYPWVLPYRLANDRIWEIRRRALYCDDIYVGVPEPSLPGLLFDIDLFDESLEAIPSQASTLLDSLSDSDLDVDETIREV